MNEKQIVSDGAARLLSPGLQGFLWYLADTVEAERQEFRLEPWERTQRITHLQSPAATSKVYDITVARGESLVSAVLILRQEGGCSKMMLMDEVNPDG